MDTTLFLTGAGGFVGRAIVRSARRTPNLDVVAVAHQTPKTDVLRLLRERKDRRGVLVHAAWPMLRGPAPDEREWRTFADWSGDLAAAAAGYGVFFAGIGSGVERYAESGMLDEPYLGYARRKTALREALNGACRDMCWARLHFLFGETERCERLVPAAIRACLAGAAFECGAAERRRCWLQVDDMAGALVKFAADPKPGIWDIAPSNALSFHELFALIERAAGKPLRLAAPPMAPPDARLPLIAPIRVAATLPPDAGRPETLLQRLRDYTQWIVRTDGGRLIRS